MQRQVSLSLKAIFPKWSLTKKYFIQFKFYKKVSYKKFPMGDSIKTLSVIIPAYNEGKTIHRILERVIAVDLHGIKKEIIIVNDCSKDNTLEAVQNFISSHNYTNLRLVSHEVNKGKGAAIRTGIQSATGNWVIVQDADLEYDPQEFNILLAPILNGFADVVYGSRFMGGKPHRILFFWHSIGLTWKPVIKCSVPII